MARVRGGEPDGAPFHPSSCCGGRMDRRHMQRVTRQTAQRSAAQRSAAQHPPTWQAASYTPRRCCASAMVSSSCSSASSASVQYSQQRSTWRGRASSQACKLAAGDVGLAPAAAGPAAAAAAAACRCRSSSWAAMWVLQRDSSAPWEVMAAVSGTERMTCTGALGGRHSRKCSHRGCQMLPAGRRVPGFCCGCS